MLPEIQNLHEVWLSNRTVSNTPPHQISFDDLTNSIISTGPFSFYIIDFFDMSLSHISPSVYEIHGFDPDTLQFNEVLNAIHPEDIDFVIKAEAFLTKFFSENIPREKLLSYKISYCHRGRLKNGEYVLFNHQALMLTMDENGGYGKSLNIHTRIDHLSNFNTYKISLIGLNGEPSFMNLSLDEPNGDSKQFSKREIDIIRQLGNGLNTTEIAEKLFISPLTVKKHRNNILEKTEAKNTAQLIKNCILQGII
ncbi:LuxR C-terminal-related transcriptional regulator [Chryseobacterium sp.]|uniref:LuxR C-terminal-related transcriptional regulator n=1 Tax=Chryseobacterium sp. TaxID=1871047 RepID=UPI0011C73691|nr:LuxR C-terminal-related transcriptional regulator [Chryseobacterium sp.]TXF77751.1 helix-turn-helix transcriptional regulator [Chryseobacterium sp.]